MAQTSIQGLACMSEPNLEEPDDEGAEEHEEEDRSLDGTEDWPEIGPLYTPETKERD